MLVLAGLLGSTSGRFCLGSALGSLPAYGVGVRGGWGHGGLSWFWQPVVRCVGWELLGDYPVAEGIRLPSVGGGPLFRAPQRCLLTTLAAHSDRKCGCFCFHARAARLSSGCSGLLVGALAFMFSHPLRFFGRSL